MKILFVFKKMPSSVKISQLGKDFFLSCTKYDIKLSSEFNVRVDE